MKFNQRNLRRPITPLWIIALFVSLTETVLGTAVIKTSGGIQVALTIFVVLFPVFIAVVFFAILWNRPYVLYPPTEYGSETNINSYVSAMQQRSYDKNKLYSSIKETIQTSISSDEIVSKLSQLAKNHVTENAENQVSQVLNSAVKNAVERILEINFITIDTCPLLGKKGRVWRVLYERYRHVSDFLDDVWESLEPHILPYTYGIKWVLSDVDSGKIFNDMGRQYARSAGKFKDCRSLQEVGLNPGIHLKAIPI